MRWSRVLSAVVPSTSEMTAVVNPGRPFSNRRALVHLVEEARNYIWWYERHLPAKVLEILADGLPQPTGRYGGIPRGFKVTVQVQIPE